MKKCLMFLLLAGCGFQPMFVDHDNDIYVAPISGINGIDLRNRLDAKLGGQRGPDATYRLNVTLAEPVTQYRALQHTGDASWQQVSITARFDLMRGDKKIASGREVASESYTFVRYLVAANASYNNAVRNIINGLADKISVRAITSTQAYEKNKATKK